MTLVRDGVETPDAEVPESVASVEGPGFAGRLLTLAVTIGACILVLVAVLEAVDVDPVLAWNSIWNSTFGSTRNFSETLVRATPLLLVALTLVPSLRAGLYNIGAPGQLAAGALAATWLALHLGGQPQAVSLVVCGVSAAATGAIVAAIPGWLKAQFGVNEIITTLAMNFIVISVIGWLLNGPFKGNYANLPQSDLVPDNSTLPILIPGTRAHYGILIALAFVPLLWALDRSVVGYRLRVFGANQQLTRQAHISRRRYLIGLMAFGGVGAGLSGWMQVVTIDRQLYPTVADPVGYAGLFVALLGGLTAVGSVVAAFILGALLHGGDGLQVGANVSPEIVQVVLGLILLAYAIHRGRSATREISIQKRRLPWRRSKR
ncbi:ABC transporter permease [Nocardioides aquiterrae]|uniref:ABC transporter permease n=1 Tax=Nocardioides aquiterrae TaxID=203799 RepID=A0ABN1UG90_9ACTN